MKLLRYKRCDVQAYGVAALLVIAVAVLRGFGL